MPAASGGDAFEIGQHAVDDGAAPDRFEERRVEGRRDPVHAVEPQLAPSTVEDDAAGERVDEHLWVDLVAQQEVARHRDTRQRDPNAPANLHRHDRERDRDPCSPLEDVVEVGVPRVEVVILIASEAKVAEQQSTQTIQGGISHLGGKFVDPSQVGGDVEPGLGMGSDEETNLVQRQRRLGAAHEFDESLRDAHNRAHATDGPGRSVVEHRTRNRMQASLSTVYRSRMRLGELLEDVLGRNLPVRVEAYDGTTLGPADAPARIIVRSIDALRRIVTAPGELGFARAYVAGDIDVEGDIFAALSLQQRLPEAKLTPKQVVKAIRLLGVRNLKPLPPPANEVRLQGRLHSRERDAAAVAAHYDVGNDFYALFLGSTMTYSCAVFERGDAMTLDEAQIAKYELICRKLDLQPGMRLLDVGCGWGGMAMHAAREHGVRAVGITLSRAQQELASKRVADAGLADVIEIRLQDYRDVNDGPYDAISSIGMFEHVGEEKTAEYFGNLFSLLPPKGRLLNHAIARPPHGGKAAVHPRGFIARYVFPDGALLEAGSVVSAMQRVGFEVRHAENLREHYAQTLRHWVANLEANWDEAVRLAGEARTRVWRLYMAGSALYFEQGATQIHQVLGVKLDDRGGSGMPHRPGWDREPLVR